jgi:hypothetical protein
MVTQVLQTWEVLLEKTSYRTNLSLTEVESPDVEGMQCGGRWRNGGHEAEIGQRRFQCAEEEPYKT